MAIRVKNRKIKSLISFFLIKARINSKCPKREILHQFKGENNERWTRSTCPLRLSFRLKRDVQSLYSHAKLGSLPHSNVMCLWFKRQIYRIEKNGRLVRSQFFAPYVIFTNRICPSTRTRYYTRFVHGGRRYLPNRHFFIIGIEPFIHLCFDSTPNRSCSKNITSELYIFW